MVDRFANMEAFVEVADQRSFSSAARRLGLSKSVISKRVDQLEAHLGVPLLRRTTRVVHTTEAGRRYYDFCREILEQVNAAERAVRREDDEPEGRLRISCPTSLGTRVVGPIACDFQKRYPKTRITLLLLDRNPNPIEEGFDISIWDQPGARGNLSYRRLGALRRVLVAAPTYLAEFGTPARPEDLYHHHIIHYQYLDEGRDWRLEHPQLGPKTARIQPCFVTNNGLLMQEVALAGKGIAMLPMFLAARDLAAGRLQVVLADWQPPVYPILALYASAVHTAAKIRLFLDDLLGAFQTEQPWS